MTRGSGAGKPKPGTKIPSDPPDCPEGARLIPLTKGHFAIIDEADYEVVSGWRWYADDDGYNVYAMSRKHGRLHRFLIGAPSGVLVDHRDGHTLDCRRANLRLCNHAENSRNRKLPRHSRGRFKGVSALPSGNFAARFRSNYVGTFTTEIEAARAWDTAAKQFYGAFARLNFPDDPQGSTAAPVFHAREHEDGERTCPYTRSVVSS